MYGFDNEAIQSIFDINYEIPAQVAQSLIHNRTDIGLVPVAAIPSIPHAQIIGTYGIAADGPVKSVCLYSDVPIHDIEAVYLDYQSRTSVRLCQLLIEEYWQKAVTWLDADDQYIEKIQGSTAGVIIGDRALQQLNQFKYVYDLSFYWKEHTGLPFVFAAWVSNKPIATADIVTFNQACEQGLHNIEAIAAQFQIDYYDLEKYYSQDIHYALDEKKLEGLSLFLHKINPSFKLNIHDHAEHH